MKNKKSIFKIIFLLFIFLLLSTSFVLTGSYLLLQISEFKERKKVAEKKYIDEKKRILKTFVEKTKSMVEYEINNFYNLSKISAKKKAIEAFNIIDNIYSNSRGLSLLNPEVYSLFVKSMDAIYDRDIILTIINKDGKIIYSSARQLREKRTYSNEKLNEKLKGDEFFYRDIFKSAAFNGEGYYENSAILSSFNDPHYRLAYYKKFKTGLVVIATINNNNIKLFWNNLFKRLSEIRLYNEGYIFLNNMDGTAIVSNGRVLPEGKKLWDIFGYEARKVFELEQNAVKKKGDFIFYKWTKITNDKKKFQKLSYVTSTLNGNMIIGSGIYIDDIKLDISKLQRNIKNKILEYVLFVVLLTLVIMMLAVYIIRKFFNNIRDDFKVFVNFFKRAAYSDEKIDKEKIKFEELDVLADYANRMLDDKIMIQKTLFQERERLKITLESIKDAVITVDNIGTIAMFNEMAEVLTGYKKAEAIGKYYGEVLNIYDIKNNKKVDIFEYSKNSIKNNTDELQLVSKNGKKYIIEDSISKVKDSNGKKVGLVFVFRDITEKLKREKEIGKVKKLESLGILAGGIAHDFNNLLTGVYGYISLAKMFMESKHRSFSYLEEAEKSINRATTLTKQLLTFSKGGAPIKERLNIAKIVIETTKFCLSKSNIVVDFDIDDDLYDIECDKEQISQVISNIVLNAKEAVHDRGKIVVKVKNIRNDGNVIGLKEGKYILISISDNGEGIRNDIIDKVFDPYFTTKKLGSGLGLTICYSIVKRHGGNIKVKSDLGKGSTFDIYLPIPSDNQKEKKNQRRNSFNNKKYPGNLRILIMDDEQIVRNVGKTMVEQMGFKVDIATNGEEAIEKYKSSIEKNAKYDVVIMDLTVVGGMGGEEAIKIIRNIDAEARVIVSSGYSSNPVLANFRDYGFCGAITKPFNMDKLKRAIERAINDNS